MATHKTGASGQSGFGRFIGNLFQERELILRSEGRIRYVRLSPLFQKSIAGYFLATFIWLVSANGYALFQDRQISQKKEEIAEARIAYEMLRGQMLTYQERVAALASDIFEEGQEADSEGSVDLQELSDVTRGIESAFDQITRDLNVSETERLRIIQSRNALHQQIATLEESLKQSNATISLLEGDLESTVSALSVEQSRVETLSGIKNRLTKQVSDLEAGLEQAEERGERLTVHVSDLTKSLNTVQDERMAVDGERKSLAADLAVVEAELSLHQAATERSRERLKIIGSRLSELTNSKIEASQIEEFGALYAVEEQIADLSAELRGARNDVVDMEMVIGEVVVGLAQVAGDSPERLNVLEKPNEKVGLTKELLDVVASVQDDQLVLIDRLTQETDDGIVQNENVLKLAGLDVDALLKISGYTPGIGGPFVALSQDHHPSSEFPQEGAAAVSSGVTVLESKLSRMAALNDLMRCVPLISPVDNYQLTSPFGKRKDPITGQPAFHKGIDIGGWAGIKVHATAAGTVTYAGRKGGYGYMVKVDHGCGIQTLYAHLKRIKVNKGQEIDHRTVIGTLGSSGRSTGPHVHYEVIVDGKVYNPAAFIEAGRHVHKI